MWPFRKDDKKERWALKRIEYIPKEDITVFELSQCLPILNFLQHFHTVPYSRVEWLDGIYTRWEKMPENSKRHFNLTMICKKEVSKCPH